MDNKKLNIAILSPNQNRYSETFIQAHKNHLEGNVFYYYGGLIPTTLEGVGDMSIGVTIEDDIPGYINNSQLKKLYLLSNSFWENNIDVVLAEYGVTAAESLVAIKSLNLPLITHFHGFDASVFDVVNKYKEHYQDVFTYSKSVIVVSKIMREMIGELGCPPEKILYIPCFPKKDFFELKPNFESAQFLAVGRFVNKKAPFYTLIAFRRVLKKHPSAVLKMAGDGPYLEICKNIAANFGMENNVEFLGMVDHEVVMRQMERSIAFIQPSVKAENGDMEGTPVAILEAGATGIPVIATRHAGIPDVVIENETGFLVDEHDVDGMSMAMLKILKDVSRSRQMGNNARNHIKQSFSQKSSIGKLNDALKSASENSSRKQDFSFLINLVKHESTNILIERLEKQINDLVSSKQYRLGWMIDEAVVNPLKLLTLPIKIIRLITESKNTSSQAKGTGR